MKKVSCIVLLLTIAGSLILMSCSDSGDTDKSNPDINVDVGEVDEVTESVEETPKILHEVPDADYGGRDFIVVDRGGWYYWNSVDMYAESETGEPINDAVFRRNKILEQKFNINIKENRQEDVLGFVQKLIQSGSDDFDVMYPTMQQSGSLLQRGLIVNLYDVPYLDFDKPWWDKVSNDSMTVEKKLYCAVGNINIMDYDATWAVLFNKDINAQHALEDPYKQVKEGKWTLDVLYSNCKQLTQDLNGDGELTPEDQWGAVNQHECAHSLWAGTGQKIVEKDENDLPVLALNNQRSIQALDKIIAFMADENAQIKADDYSGKYENEWEEVNIKTFRESRALYYISPIESVKFLRDMEANFGILPLPKYDETQPQYYNTVQYGNATVMCIPQSAGDLERTGGILEAWAAESVDTLTKAYYEVTLKGKYSRDEESEEMLDLIFSTRILDVGLIFNWSGMLDFFGGFSRRKTVDFGSQYEKLEPRWITAIDKSIASIQESN